jgi:hypothetical protein
VTIENCDLLAMSSPAADPALYIMRCQRLRERLLPPRGTLHPAKFERIYGAALAEISSFSISSARIWCSSASLRRLTIKTGSVLSRARRRHLSACSLKYDWSIAPLALQALHSVGASQASLTALSMMYR